MVLTPLTEEQRSAALKKAFDARVERAEAKTDLKSGKKTLAEVLAEADASEALQKMKVYDLLRAIPKVGDRRAEAIMEEVGIAMSRRIRGLGVHQRAALLEKFE